MINKSLLCSGLCVAGFVFIAACGEQAKNATTSAASNNKLTNAVAISPSETTSQPQSLRIFRGICDGSAAASIGGNEVPHGTARLLVGYDEANELFEFDSAGGRYLGEFSYADILPAGAHPEADLEGVAAVGQNLWWLGSHGRDGDGEDAPNRRVLFVTEARSGAIAPLPGPPLDVLQLPGIDLFLQRLGNQARQEKPKKGGINFEALASTVAGGLLVGVRSPLSEGRSGDAMLLQLENHAVHRFSVTALHQLNLANRGVRAMARWNDGYLIVAGQVAAGGEFGLYYWQVDRELHQLPLLNGDLNAEGLVAVRDGWLVLSDDGKVVRADESAADGDRGCDKIRRKNPLGSKHRNVFFRAQFLSNEKLVATLAAARAR